MAEHLLTPHLQHEASPLLLPGFAWSSQSPSWAGSRWWLMCCASLRLVVAWSQACLSFYDSLLCGAVPVQLGSEMPTQLSWACLTCRMWLLPPCWTPQQEARGPASAVLLGTICFQRLRWDWKEGSQMIIPPTQSAPSCQL